MQALMDEDLRLSPEGSYVLDWDPICQCQDFLRLRATVRVKMSSATTATATVDFRDNGMSDAHDAHATPTFVNEHATAHSRSAFRISRSRMGIVGVGHALSRKSTVAVAVVAELIFTRTVARRRRKILALADRVPVEHVAALRRQAQTPRPSAPAFGIPDGHPPVGRGHRSIA